MNNDYTSKNRCSFLLRFHLILVCKYRRKLLSDNNISTDIKKLSSEIAEKHGVQIKHVETDKDHIHYMIETTPNINLSDFVRILKQYTTYHIWQKYENFLLQIL